MLSKTFNMETIACWTEGDEVQTEYAENKLIQVGSQGFIMLGEYFYATSDLQHIIRQLVTFEKQINAGK